MEHISDNLFHNFLEYIYGVIIINFVCLIYRFKAIYTDKYLNVIVVKIEFV